MEMAQELLRLAQAAESGHLHQPHSTAALKLREVLEPSSLTRRQPPIPPLRSSA